MDGVGCVGYGSFLFLLVKLVLMNFMNLFYFIFFILCFGDVLVLVN